jgi:hypothetical protein
VTEARVNGGRRKTLPAILALTVAAAGAFVLFLSSDRGVNVASAPAPNSPRPSLAAEAVLRLEISHQGLHEAGRQRQLEIERALVSNNPRQRDAAFGLLLPELLDLDSARVVELVARQEGETRNNLRDEVVRLWIRKDRDAAVMWMASFENEWERKASAAVAMRTLAAINPAQAIAVAGEFDAGRDDGSLEHIVQIWAAENFDECMRWLESRPDSPQTAQLRARIEQVREPASPGQRD